MRALEQATLVAELRSRQRDVPWGRGKTYHFPGTKIGSSPRGGVGRATVEAPPANPVAQLGCCIVGVADGVVVLSREGVRERASLAGASAGMGKRRAVVGRRDMVWV